MSQKADELQAKHPNRRITGHVCDVTQSSQVTETVNQVREKHGSRIPNVVVNSAGIAIHAPIVKMTEQEFDRIIAINLKGTFLVTQAVVKLLVDNFPNVAFSSPLETYASIVNMSSAAAKHGLPEKSGYSMTKAGVDGFAKALGKELAQYRIRVNSVMPSYIETPMVMDQVTDASRKQMFVALTPMKRMGLPEEVAQTALFLASDASSYITSTSLDITGGF